MVAATTAGNDQSSFAWTEHEYCERIAREPSLDPARFVYIRNTPADARWDLERNWRHANPALGDFLSIEALREEAREAKINPAAENRFRQFRLNQWVQQATRWIPLHHWVAAAGDAPPKALEEQLAGQSCYGGLLLKTASELVALCWDFPDAEGGHDAIWRFFVPADAVPSLDSQTGGQVSAWVRQGFIRATPGNAVDFEAIRAQIEADAKRFEVVRLAYYRWQMAQLTQQLHEEGLPVLEMGLGYGRHAAATKEWERAILERRYRHGGNPVMRWMFDAIAVKANTDGDIKIDQPRSGAPVHGCIAAVMALDVATSNPALEPLIAWA